MTCRESCGISDENKTNNQDNNPYISFHAHFFTKILVFVHIIWNQTFYISSFRCHLLTPLPSERVQADHNPQAPHLLRMCGWYPWIEMNDEIFLEISLVNWFRKFWIEKYYNQMVILLCYLDSWPHLVL